MRLDPNQVRLMILDAKPSFASIFQDGGLHVATVHEDAARRRAAGRHLRRAGEETGTAHPRPERHAHLHGGPVRDARPGGRLRHVHRTGLSFLFVRYRHRDTIPPKKGSFLKISLFEYS